jgi:hypothetical protein
MKALLCQSQELQSTLSEDVKQANLYLKSLNERILALISEIYDEEL